MATILNRPTGRFLRSVLSHRYLGELLKRAQDCLFWLNVGHVVQFVLSCGVLTRLQKWTGRTESLINSLARLFLAACCSLGWLWWIIHSVWWCRFYHLHTAFQSGATLFWVNRWYLCCCVSLRWEIWVLWWSLNTGGGDRMKINGWRCWCDELLTDELDLGTGHDDHEGNRYKVQQ